MFKSLNIGHLFLRRMPILILVITLFASCGSKKQQRVVYEKFPVTTPALKDTFYVNEYVADIHSVRNIEVRARIGGFIETIHIDEGQFVKEGQLLFSISSQEYKQELTKARASLASAVAEAKSTEVELNSVKMLASKNVVSKSELDIAQARWEAQLAKIEEAKADEASAELKLSFAKVRAPFSGVVNRISNKIGSLIEEGTLLTTLSDNHEVFAYFNVSEKEYLNLVGERNIDQRKNIVLTLANNKQHPYKGVIETVESEMDKSTGNIAFRARFPNPDLILKNGATGKIAITNPLDSVLLIPQKSTFEIQDNIYVYVVDNKNKVQIREIKPRLRIPHFYVIESGVTDKDRIVYEGIQRVKEGDQIDPQPIQMQNIMVQLDGL